MPNFNVIWEIDIDADNADEAAKKAWEIMRDQIGPVFKVHSEDGEENVIDLLEDEEE